MIIQEWVSKEEIKIDREAKSKKRLSETLDFFRISFLLLAVFFCISSAKAECGGISVVHIEEQAIIIEDHRLQADDGIWFMCNVCRLCQWQSNANRDFMGNFYCLGCKTKYTGK